MPYLIANDYLNLIQSVNLTQLQVNTPAIRAQAEQRAQAEAVSMLRQKYDTTKEFTDTTVWNKANAYNAYDRVYLDASAWVTLTAYIIGDLVLEAGNIYECNTNNSDASFTVGKWDLLGVQYKLFYAQYPKPVFDLANGIYKKGDEVFWKGKVYTNIVPTKFPDHQTLLNIGNTQDIPYGNIFPDDPANGLQNWGAGVDYYVPANTDILTTDYWTLGDNRDLQMVDKLCSMTIFHLCSTAPQNRPIQWSLNYKGDPKEAVINANGETIYPIYSALGWLQACARGGVTPALPLLQPPSGARIRFGGNAKTFNGY